MIRKSEKIAGLVISNDLSVRAAKVDVTSHERIITLKRPINKLFPVEFSNQHIIEPTFFNEKNVPQVVVGAVFCKSELCTWFQVKRDFS